MLRGRGRVQASGLARAAAVATLAVGAACASVGAADDPTIERATATTLVATASTSTTSAPPPLPLPEATTTSPPPAPPPATEAAAPTSDHPARIVHEQAWMPYATVGPVTLHHPVDRTEAIGFHQSGHDGAQAQDALGSAVRWFTMESRDRDTIARGAADLVVEPGREVRSPVSGTVIRGGTYTLYCDHVDQYVVIEPDARPGWEVKVLHIEGLAVSAGQHLDAGVTRLAASARVLPFPSQVEDSTGQPPWPHVHIEVVDPTVPDRPTGPGCP